jgi:hypothetical protein
VFRAVVVLQLLKMKDRLAEAEEEKTKLIAAAAAAGGVGAGAAGSSSPSSSSFSTVTYHPAALVGQFGVDPEEAAADLTYMSEYAYNNYMNMMDLAPGYFGGVVYDHFN